MEERWPTSPTCSCAATCAAARPPGRATASAGGVRREGVGLSYAFRARTAVISEVPVEDRELSLVAHARTRRLRPRSACRWAVTWRVVEPGLAAQRLDFGIDTRTGRWRSTPLDALATLLGELAQEPVVDAAGGHRAGRRR